MSALFVPTLGIDVPFDEVSCMATFTNLLANENAILLIAPGGMLGGLTYPHFFNQNRWIAQELFYWVDIEHRGNGTARLLLDAFETWAKVKGAHLISLIALDAQRPQAVGELYRRRGYQAMEHSYFKPLSQV